MLNIKGNKNNSQKKFTAQVCNIYRWASLQCQDEITIRLYSQY